MNLLIAKCSFAAAAALLMVTLTTNAHANDRFQLGIGGGAHFVPMDSMDALTSQTAYGVVRLDASVSLPEISLIRGYELDVGMRWEAGSIEGTTYNRVHSNMDLDALFATAKLRRQLWGPISAFGEAQLGVQWASLQLDDMQSSNARPLDGDSTAALVGLGGGLELRLNRQFDLFQFSVRFDAHYQLATSMAFDATPMSGGEDSLEIDTQASNLGSVNTTGTSLGMSILARF